MAYKVVDSEVLDNGLHGIADKIREKSGTTEELVFPEGFENAVDSIVGSKEEEEKTLSVTKNGNYEVIPAEGKAMSKVNVDVNVAPDDVGKPYIDSSEITNFRYFASYDKLNHLVDKIDTSNGTTFSSMFAHSELLEVIPQINTSKGTDFSEMFRFCKSLETVPLLDLGNATKSENMFNGCEKLKSVPRFNTSKVINMQAMFKDCKSLTTVPQLDISKVESFSSMFSGCESLETLPPFEIKRVFYSSSLTHMFGDCTNLKTVAITSDCSLATSTFYKCTALENITIGEGWSVNIYLHYSNNLTVESLHGMIENLADLTGQTAKTFQIGATNLAKIDAEHLAMLQNKNWNYS